MGKVFKGPTCATEACSLHSWLRLRWRKRSLNKKTSPRCPTGLCCLFLRAPSPSSHSSFSPLPFSSQCFFVVLAGLVKNWASSSWPLRPPNLDVIWLFEQIAGRLVATVSYLCSSLLPVVSVSPNILSSPWRVCSLVPSSPLHLHLSAGSTSKRPFTLFFPSLAWPAVPGPLLLSSVTVETQPFPKVAKKGVGVCVGVRACVHVSVHMYILLVSCQLTPTFLGTKSTHFGCRSPDYDFLPEPTCKVAQWPCRWSIVGWFLPGEPLLCLWRRLQRCGRTLNIVLFLCEIKQLNWCWNPAEDILDFTGPAHPSMVAYQPLHHSC